MILLLDNYDSFTYNLKDYLLQLGAEVRVIRNDELSVDEILALKPRGIILSPGPGEPSDAGVMLELINACYSHIPIFGVCLGMQALAVHFGGKILRAEYPMHGKVSNIKLMQHPMFEGLGSLMDVCRYHSLIVDIEGVNSLEVCAESALGEPMAIADEGLMAWGVQFHPEAILTQNGISILANWLKHINLHTAKSTKTIAEV